jgi:predicted unusual protein kinase regulating ubiquinone biosynthesis (AarF/ABC1/UbiB family)
MVEFRDGTMKQFTRHVQPQLVRLMELTYERRKRSTWLRHYYVMLTAANMLALLQTKSCSKVEVATWLAGKLPELGPTYVKVGQFVSAREDIFGEDIAACFRSLQDAAPSVPFDEVMDIVLRQGPIFVNAFDRIEAVPLASASIAQVHQARLSNGADVVLKVKRPHLDELIEADLAPLRFLVDALASTGVSPEAKYAKALLMDFMQMMREEVDFDSEVRNNMDFQRLYARRRDVVIPRVVPRLCTREIIVMEYIPSKRILDQVRQKTSQDDRDYGEVLAYRIMTVFVGQVLYRGALVHGDPQPGNVGITDDGSIVLYDFGSALRLSEGERTKLKLLMYNLITGNAPKSLQALKGLGVRVLDERLALEYMRTYAAYMRTMDFRAFNTERKEMPFALTDTLLRLVRIFGILEGMCKKLYSRFDYTSMAIYTWDAFILDADFVTMKAMDDLEALSSSSPPPSQQ